MTLKNNWVSGDTVTATALNDVATAVNALGSLVTVNSLGNLASTFTLTSSAATGIAFGTLNANTIITLPPPVAGAYFTLVLKQDGTGGWTPTFGGATVDYPAGDPAWIPDANSLNILEFRAWDIIAWRVFPVTSNAEIIIDPSTVGGNWFQPGYISGNYYHCNSTGATSTSVALGNGSVRVSPWAVTQSVTITRLFAEFTLAGDAASVFRIGLWADDGTGRPSTLVLDAGSISTGTGNAGTVVTGGTPGVYEITVSKALLPGLYWVGGAIQGVTTTQPTMRTVSAGNINSYLPLGTSLPGTNSLAMGWTQTGVTGAFSTFSAPAVNATVARIGFKVA